MTSNRKCITILTYNYVVYLHQGASLVNGKGWICEYCKNLFLHHQRSKSITFHSLKIIHALRTKSFFHLSFMVGAPCHHGLIWGYCKTLIHHHLNLYFITIGPLYAIHAWMLFYVFSQRGKKKALLEKSTWGKGVCNDTQCVHLSPMALQPWRIGK
jgi:hypothetical protein